MVCNEDIRPFVISLYKTAVPLVRVSVYIASTAVESIP